MIRRYIYFLAILVLALVAAVSLEPSPLAARNVPSAGGDTTGSAGVKFSHKLHITERVVLGQSVSLA
jgi:hypothetical protein